MMTDGFIPACQSAMAAIWHCIGLGNFEFSDILQAI